MSEVAPVPPAVAKLSAGPRQSVPFRMASDFVPSGDQPTAIADLVVDNSGDLAHLRAEIDKAWAWIEDNRHATETATSP